MTNARQIVATTPARPSKLWPKMLGLFGVTFVALLALFVAYDIFMGFAERAVTSRQAAEVTAIVIDPKLATDLTAVLAAPAEEDTSAVRDSFTDRAGLSGTVANVPAASGPQFASPTTTSVTGQGVRGPTVSRGTSSDPASAGTGPTPIESTKRRYNEWLERFRVAGAMLDPTVFAIEDLAPVGIVDGGSGQQEVMFYSEAVGKTFSFPIGTLFYDGWLTEVRQEGVVFSFNDQGRTVRMRTWARELKAGG